MTHEGHTEHTQHSDMYHEKHYMKTKSRCSAEKEYFDHAMSCVFHLWEYVLEKHVEIK
jgi:hypothetical protein